MSAKRAKRKRGNAKGKQAQVCSYYAPELVEQLRAVAKASGRTLAAVMREAAEDVVRKYADTGKARR
jgi:predicted DNA-binding protein